MNRPTSALGLLLFVLPLTSCSSSDDTPTPKPSPWAGHQYYLDIAQKNWATPSRVGPDLYGIAPAFLFKVNPSGSSVTIATAPGTRPIAPDSSEKELIPVEDAQQDPCGPTLKVPLGGSYPKSEIAPDELSMFVLNAVTPPLQTTADVFGLKLENVLPNGDTPAAGTLEATMNFEQLYVLFAALGPSRDKDSVCANVKAQYTTTGCLDSGDPSCVVQCEPCPDNGDPYCLTVTAEDLGAVEAPNLEIVDVDKASRPASCDDTVL